MMKIFTGIWLLAASVMTLLLLPTEEANAWKVYNGKFHDYSNTVYWYVVDNVDDVLDVSNAKFNASIAANLWDDNNISDTALNFVEASQVSSAQVVLTTTQTTGKPAGETLCTYGFYIQDCNIFLNSVDYTWFVDGTMDENNDEADVRTVSLHEFGHTVGWHHKRYFVPM